jgi:hypothetical protein
VSGRAFSLIASDEGTGIAQSQAHAYYRLRFDGSANNTLAEIELLGR